MGQTPIIMIMQVCCVVIIASSLILCQEVAVTSISQVYSCIPALIPKTETVICRGKNSTIALDIFYQLEFKVLEDEGNKLSHDVGLCNFTVHYADKFSDLKKFMYSLEFNSSVAVGKLKGLNDCKSGRPCNVTMLDDILQLPVFNKQFWPWGERSLWNFSSPVFGVKQKWLQGLSVRNGQYHTILSSLTLLQNTSIQSLIVTGMAYVDVIHLKDMPLLKTVDLASENNLLFHPECFVGTPKVESLTIQGYQLKKIPALLTRLPNLRYLKFSSLNYSEHVVIATDKLSGLHNLESLSLENMEVVPISFKLPALLELKKLTLSKCQITKLEETDFVNFPALQELNLSGNKLSSLMKNTFINLRHLKVLNLSQNKLLNWPVLYQCSLKILDLSQNALQTVENLGKMGTTVEFLNISLNKIARWNDRDIFSQNNFGSSSPIIFPYTHTDSSEVQNSDHEYEDALTHTELLEDEEVEESPLCSLLLPVTGADCECNNKTRNIALLVKALKHLDRLGSLATPFNYSKDDNDTLLNPLNYFKNIARLGSSATPFNHSKDDNDMLLNPLNYFKNIVLLGSLATPFNYSEEDALLLNQLDCSRYLVALGSSTLPVSSMQTKDDDEFDGNLWVKSIDLSNNNLFNGLSEVMVQSLAGLQHLDLGGNPFHCDGCKMAAFQKWLNSTSTNVTNFGVSTPLQCLFPPNNEGLRIAEIHFNSCPEVGSNVSVILEISIGVLLLMICIACGLVYMYKFQRRPPAGFTQL